jgi:UDP-N-acetylglucosamine--N-acetylmuramyl-(pentapeptide) pyrophosphoryl-undecaprenol N-acetylglucosamine transferase
VKHHDAKNILIMAGGTGGHVYPALATAQVLQASGYQVEWLGTRVGIEARLVPAAGIRLNCLSVTGLRGKRLRVLLKAPVLLPLAVFQALRVCMRFRPACVLGMGGFASGPGGISAWLLRIPLVIHEQNAVPGSTNRILSRFAQVVLEGFAGAFDAVEAQFCGNPVRRQIAELPPPEQRGLGEHKPLRILVLGGSLGAQALNQTLPAALALLPVSERPSVWHQSGAKHYEDTLTRYREAGVEALIAPYIDDMAAAYAWADAVVCRAGALTVAELAAAGLPSLLVPYPHAIDDHQSHNALWLSQRGGALLMPQGQLNAASLAQRLADWVAQPAALLTMARQARACARPQAAQQVAQHCMEVAHV